MAQPTVDLFARRAQDQLTHSWTKLNAMIEVKHANVLHGENLNGLTGQMVARS